MWIIGDVHKEFKTYRWICEKSNFSLNREDEMFYSHSWEDMPHSTLREVMPDGLGLDCTLQLGDMCIYNERDTQFRFPDASKHKFFRGNHDNPAVIKTFPQNLGEGGYLPDQQMFYVPGGYSIDWKNRQEGRDWWRDEELSMKDLMSLVEQFGDLKPRIMISHEAPTHVKDYVITNNWKIEYSSRTEMALAAMFDIWQPELWVFGHYHCRKDITMSNKAGMTNFVCLGELIHDGWKDCIYEIPGLQW